MEEQLISIETGRVAKEKGFDIPVVNYYTTISKKYKIHYLTTGPEYESDRDCISNWNNDQGNYPTLPEEVECSAPTQSLLQKWLREKYDIDLWVEKYPNEKTYVPQCPKLNIDRVIGYYNTYEEALEAGLIEALKLIK